MNVQIYNNSRQLNKLWNSCNRFIHLDSWEQSSYTTEGYIENKPMQCNWLAVFSQESNYYIGMPLNFHFLPIAAVLMIHEKRNSELHTQFRHF